MIDLSREAIVQVSSLDGCMTDLESCWSFGGHLLGLLHGWLHAMEMAALDSDSPVDCRHYGISVGGADWRWLISKSWKIECRLFKFGFSIYLFFINVPF